MKNIEIKLLGVEFDKMPNEEEFEKIKENKKSVHQYIYIFDNKVEESMEPTEGYPMFDDEGIFEDVSSYNDGLIKFRDGVWNKIYYGSSRELGKKITGFKVIFENPKHSLKSH